MTLEQFAKAQPLAIVTLFFKSDQGEGKLVCSAEHAFSPNRSGRYFPPDNISVAELGWPVPYWYAHEVRAWAQGRA